MCMCGDNGQGVEFIMCGRLLLKLSVLLGNLVSNSWWPRLWVDGVIGLKRIVRKDNVDETGTICGISEEEPEGT